MKTVLFAFEENTPFDAIVAAAGLAHELGVEAVRVVLAVNDLVSARLAIGATSDVTVLQAPVWPRARHLGPNLGNGGFADHLAALGFGHRPTLRAVTSAWNGLLEMLRPDAVVAWGAPGIAATLFGRTTPLIFAGSPAHLPPLDGAALASLRPHCTPVVSEANLLAALGEPNESAPVRLVELFRGFRRVVCGAPEFDPYAGCRLEPIHTPFEPMPCPSLPPASTRVFAALDTSDPQAIDTLQGLMELDVEIEAYLPGAIGITAAVLAGCGHRIHATPPPLREAVARASHVLHAGSLTLACAALAAGRPQFIIDSTWEAEQIADPLIHLGIAIGLGSGRAVSGVEAGLASALFDHALLERARRISLAHAARPQPDGRRALVSAIRECLA